MKKPGKSPQLLLIFLFSLLVFSVTSFKFLDDDLFWHLSTGKFIAEKKVIPSNDVFGFATQGDKWIPFEWAWDLSTYAIYNISGYSGISVFRSILCIAMFLLIFLIANKLKINFMLTCLLNFLILFGGLSRFTPRPQLVTYIFISLTLYLIIGYKQFDKGNIKRLYFLPAIFLIWANFHMGVTIGVLILMAFAASEFFNRNKNSDLIKILIVCGLSCMALLCNPNFIETYLYMYSHTQMKMLEEINEWKSPFSPGLRGNYYTIIYFLFVVLSLSIFKKYRKDKDLFPLIILAGIFYLSINSIRFRVDFLLCTAPFIMLSLNNVFSAAIKKSERIWNVSLAVLIVIVIYGSATNKLYSAIMNTSFRESGFGVNEKYFPVNLIEFMKQNKIYGDDFRIYNSLKSGGFLIWQIEGYKNLIDTRNLNDEIYSKYKSIEQMKTGFENVISKNNINGFLFSTPYMVQNAGELKRTVISYLSKNGSDWKLVYWDDKSLLFLKNDNKFANITQPNEYRYLTPYNFLFEREVILKALSNDKETLLKEAKRKYKEDPEGVFINEMIEKFNLK